MRSSKSAKPSERVSSGILPSSWVPRLAGTIACAAIAFAVDAAPATPASAFVCPISTLAAARPPASLAATADASCLIAAKDLKPTDALYDLRDRAEFSQFHLPGAASASVETLASQPRSGDERMVVYDSGRIRSDAFLVCARLRNAGLARIRVLDGGIAAWAQLHAPERLLNLNRLSDADVVGALADASSRTVASSETLRAALRRWGIAALPSTAAPARAVILADANASSDAIQAQLAKSRGAFYWQGSAERLHALLGAQMAQERKRVAGPAEPSVCGAL